MPLWNLYEEIEPIILTEEILLWCGFTKHPSLGYKEHFRWNGMLQEDMKNKEKRIHPTQKPVQLYKWLLTKYAKEGDKIFDSHFGSLSIGIACHDLSFQLDACELDKEYYEQAKKGYIIIKDN